MTPPVASYGNHYLGRLAARLTNQLDVLEPRRLSKFEDDTGEMRSVETESEYVTSSSTPTPSAEAKRTTRMSPHGLDRPVSIQRLTDRTPNALPSDAFPSDTGQSAVPATIRGETVDPEIVSSAPLPAAVSEKQQHHLLTDRSVSALRQTGRLNPSAKPLDTPVTPSSSNSYHTAETQLANTPDEKDRKPQRKTAILTDRPSPAALLPAEPSLTRAMKLGMRPAARPARTASVDIPAPVASPPTVNITIGRVEVRAAVTSPAMAKSGPKASAPLSLQDYLRAKAKDA